jgi:flagella synthesis protein FlgN
MLPNEHAPLLITTLTAEHAAWQILQTTLDAEEHALVDGEADRLAQLDTAKLTQMQTIGKLARARHDALQAAGLVPDAVGMDAWLAQHAQPEHHVRWQQLRAMEQQAQAANQRIGKLIEMRLSATRQALNVLIHAATNQGGLYDQAGQAIAARSGKPLTAA